MDKQTKYATKCMMTMPVMNGKEPIGVIMALNKQGAEEFSKSDQEVIEIFPWTSRTRLLSVALDGFPTCTRETSQWRLKSIFSLPGFLSLTCILTSYFCHHYDSSTYNPVRKGKLTHHFLPFEGLTGHPWKYVSDQATDLTASKRNR